MKHTLHTFLTGDAPHGLVLALLDAVVLVYLATAVVARVSLWRLTRTRRRALPTRQDQAERQEITS